MTSFADQAQPVEQARRGRPPRQEESPRRERRRREGDAETLGLKLPIPDWVRDKYPPAQFAYYWFTGTAARLHQAHKNDWDPVEGGEGGRLPGASDKEGKPTDHVLCVKYKDWYEQDRRPREALRLEQEEQMRRGNVAGQGDDAGGAALSSDVSYASENNRLA